MWANTTDIMERHLGERVIAVCKRLSLESFEPRSYRTSFTAHHWAHTWLDENQPRTESPDDETVLDRTEGKEPAPSDIKPIDDGTLRMLGRLFLFGASKHHSNFLHFGRQWTAVAIYGMAA